VLREARVRIHQARFRGRVVPAYREQCVICRLKVVRLLEAAHIVGDIEEAGEPVVSNGLALCSIHHRAYDHDLVGVSPDYDVRVSPRLLEDEDGPMLDLLKTFDRQPIHVPAERSGNWIPNAWRPGSTDMAANVSARLSEDAWQVLAEPSGRQP
jgi:putative restriction endonuclease